LHTRRERTAWFAAALAGGAAAELGSRAMPRLDASASFRDALLRVREMAEMQPAPLLRAKLSVTEAKRAWEATRDAETPAYRPAVDHAIDPLAWAPERLRGVSAPSLTMGPQLGTLMHRFLANMKLHDLGKTLKLRAEVQRQVADGLLTEDEAAALRLDDLVWLFGTPIGASLLTLQGRLHRERPFTVAVEGARLHPAAAGRTMILQGILDVLFRGPDGWVIVDYKTDRADSPEKVARLVQAYSVQMRLYSLLVEETLGEKVSVAWLVFLRGREAVAVDPSTVSMAWEDVLASGAVIFPEATESDPSIRWI
jgi:ATP-dependent helicase/nuclease subunit A